MQIALAVAAIAWSVGAGDYGTNVALIPTLIAVTAHKFFGSKKDADQAFGEHPAVAFVFRALATGEMDGVADMVDEDFHAYANGYPVVDPTEGDAVQLFEDNVAYWRSAVPDLEVEIYDEVHQKEPDKTDGIAVRFVFTGTLTSSGEGAAFEVEAAAFAKVVDHKITEWRVVVDESFFQELRHAMGQ